jgi:hypothetical protein
MAKSFLTDINLNNNVLLNAKIQAWGSTPTGTTNPSGSGTAVAGQLSSYNGALYIFNGTAWVAVGSAGTITSVTGTSPVVSSGGTTPAISLASGYGDTQNPYASKTANYVLAAPNGSNAVPTFRALVAADIPTLNQNTTGSAATLTTARTINGTSFDGSANITVTAAAGTLTGSTLNSGVTASSLTSVGTLANLTVTNAITGSVSGNAGTATILATARNINGVSFNGSANITVTATATNALTIGTGLSGTSYNGSSAVTIAATAGSTSAAGILQLTDSTSSTSTSTAATPASVKSAYDLANAALPKAGGTMSGAIAMGNSKITGLGTPTADGDAATKLYVDTIATGLHVHPSVNYATTGALGTTGNLVGGTITTTYNNGTSGVDATLTIATSSNWTNILIDGQSLTVNDRVLIKNQGGTASNLQNGIYFVTQVGTVGSTTSFIFKRALDADQSPEIDAGDLTYVVAGTVNGGDGYVQNVKDVTVGTTAIQWSQFSGAGAVPLATISSVGIASFPTAQFSVSAGGAVSIDTLSGNVITSGTVADGRIASALTGKTYNGLTVTSSTGTLTVTNAKTLSVSNTLTLAGTDSTTMTFPGTSATIARTDAGQTFTGVNTFTSPSITTSLTTGSTSFDLLNATATTINFAGAATTLNLGADTTSSSTTNLGLASNVAGGLTRTVNIATGATATGANVTVNIATSANTTNTTAVNVGHASTTTTITGVVRVPTVGTSGFVRAGASGGLSASALAYSDLPTNVGVVARKVSLVGTGSGTTIALTHGLGTNLVTAQVYDTSTSTATLVETDITVTSTVATATFAATTTLSNYTLVVVG